MAIVYVPAEHVATVLALSGTVKFGTRQMEVTKTKTSTPVDTDQFNAEIAMTTFDHGLKAKAGDTTAGILLAGKRQDGTLAEDTWGDFASGQEAAEAAVNQCIANLYAGVWAAAGGGGPRIPEPYSDVRDLIVAALVTTGMKKGDATGLFMVQKGKDKDGKPVMRTRPTSEWKEAVRVFLCRKHGLTPDQVSLEKSQEYLDKVYVPAAQELVDARKRAAKNAVVDIDDFLGLNKAE